ncbi:MAG: serine hydrolase [Patescibacteria group bacterium]
MKKIFSTFLLFFLISGLTAPAGLLMAASQSADFSVNSSDIRLAAVSKKVVSKKKAVAPVLTAKDLLGRLVLQKESGNKLWYIEPLTKERYYLKDDQDLEELAASVGVKVPSADFARLAKNSKAKTPASLLNKYRGQIIIPPVAGAKSYYLNPADGICYIINNFRDFQAAAKVIGLSASDALLRQIAMNSRQATYDPAWNGTAYVAFDGEKYSNGQESDRILPLASLSKVMTALVFIETEPDWNKVVEITPEEIKYPCTLQACGSTSEINLKAGDRIRIIDLWVGMLAASSNQSAVILADNSGLSRTEFIKKMNEKAASLGLAKTHFVEMSGLSADNISTAKEFAKLANVAFYNSWIAEATRSIDYVFTVQQGDGSPRDVRVLNRNSSLLAMGPEASKTGYLVEAQRNAAVWKDNKTIVTLHCYSLDQRNSIVKRLLVGSTMASAQ